jgi:hypothetical protein
MTHHANNRNHNVLMKHLREVLLRLQEVKAHLLIIAEETVIVVVVAAVIKAVVAVEVIAMAEVVETKKNIKPFRCVLG